MKLILAASEMKSPRPNRKLLTAVSASSLSARHCLSTLLRAQGTRDSSHDEHARRASHRDLAAIVTVTDDAAARPLAARIASSARDIRNCMVALSKMKLCSPALSIPLPRGSRSRRPQFGNLFLAPHSRHRILPSIRVSSKSWPSAAAFSRQRFRTFTSSPRWRTAAPSTANAHHRSARDKENQTLSARGAACAVIDPSRTPTSSSLAPARSTPASPIS